MDALTGLKRYKAVMAIKFKLYGDENKESTHNVYLSVHLDGNAAIHVERGTDGL
jgi:hypothetical protein